VHDTEELESTQSIIHNECNKLNKAIYPNHHFNSYRGYRLPKLANQASQARSIISVQLEIRITSFQLIDLQICLF
jgi:hypothetical protein